VTRNLPLVPAPDIDLIAALPELTVLGVALAVMLFNFVIPRHRARFPLLAAGGLFAAILLSLQNLSGPFAGPVFAGAAVFDGWTALFRILFYGAALCALLQALPANVGRRASDAKPVDDTEAGRHADDYAALVLLSAVGMSVMAASRDFLVTVIGLELMSLSIYPLLVLAGSTKGHEAASKYFLMGAVASAIMLFGLSFLFSGSGTTRYDGVVLHDTRSLLGFTLFLIGLFFKIAAVPFHSWMPDVYEATPAPLGGFMASGVKAAAFAAMGRLLLVSIAGLGIDLPFPPQLVQILMGLSAATLFMGNAAALMQSDIGRLLGYSAIAHTGFILMGAAASAQVGGPFGILAIAVYLVAYAPAAIGAFAALGSIEWGEGSRPDPLSTGNRHASRLRGLFHRHPVQAVALAIVLASFAGLPPTAGFWAKLNIFIASYQAGHIGLLAVALLNSLLAAVYYVRLIRETFAHGEGVPAGPGPISAVVLVLCSILLLLSGIVPDVMMNAAAMAVTGISR
jgi:NADH-quinone oxidoreductase subunit N